MKPKWITYKVFRSLKTGKFVSRRYAMKHKATTFQDTIRYKI